MRISAGKSCWIPKAVPLRRFELPRTVSRSEKSRKPAIIGRGLHLSPFGATPVRFRPNRWTLWKTKSSPSFDGSFSWSFKNSLSRWRHSRSVSLSGSGIFVNIRLLRLERVSKSTIRNSMLDVRYPIVYLLRHFSNFVVSIVQFGCHVVNFQCQLLSDTHLFNEEVQFFCFGHFADVKPGSWSVRLYRERRRLSATACTAPPPLRARIRRHFTELFVWFVA